MSSGGTAEVRSLGLDVKVVRFYTAFQFFFNLLVWVPVFYEFQKRVGLSDPQIFGIQSIYYLAFCLFEVPTGWFADRFGYRTSMRVGAFVLIVANALPPLLPTYNGFLWHFLLVGLARSLISGASSAWLYDYSLERGVSHLYKKTEGDARFYSLIGKVVSWAAVGWLMVVAPNSPYWLSTLNAAVALMAAFYLPKVSAELSAVRHQSEKSRSSSPIKAFKAVSSQPSLILLMLQGVGIFVLVRILQVNLYQPVLRANGFDLTTFGWIMSVMTIFEALGSKFAPQLRRLASDLTAVTIATIVLAVTTISLSGFGFLNGQKPLIIMALSLFSLAAGLAFPIQRQVLNDAISDSSIRATILSLESIIDRAVCAICVLPLGGLIERGALGVTLLVSGVTTIAFAALVHIGVRVVRGRSRHFGTSELTRILKN